jgi:hypothetical protein
MCWLAQFEEKKYIHLVSSASVTCTSLDRSIYLLRGLYTQFLQFLRRKEGPRHRTPKRRPHIMPSLLASHSLSDKFGGFLYKLYFYSHIERL